MAIKALLIDSGGVLNGPRTGHWMITSNFFDYVDQKQFQRIESKKRRQAFQNAMTYLSGVPKMLTLEEELLHFKAFYQILFGFLGELNVSENAIHTIAYDMVYNKNKYVFYEDVYEVIGDLNKTYDMGVVSDAWPSLHGVFDEADMKRYFKSFIVSCEEGVTKPHKSMYCKALEDLGVEAIDVVFIDDRIKNCNGAKAVGIQKTFLMCRWKWSYWYRKLTVRQHIVVRDFRDLQVKLNRLDVMNPKVHDYYDD